MHVHPGRERWSVKTGCDPAASTIDLSSPVTTTIAEMIAFPAPTTPPKDTRLGPYERTAYTMVCTLVRVHLEADGDYHCVVCDKDANTMVIEVVDPACVDASSVWLRQIRTCRASFVEQFKPRSEGWTAVNRAVTVTGVGFFDFSHGQAGCAPNAVELHPVLSIEPV